MSKGEQLVFHYPLLRQHSLNDSHSGNGSVRLNDSFVITKKSATQQRFIRRQHPPIHLSSEL